MEKISVRNEKREIQQKGRGARNKKMVKWELNSSTTKIIDAYVIC